MQFKKYLLILLMFYTIFVCLNVSSKKSKKSKSKRTKNKNKRKNLKKDDVEKDNDAGPHDMQKKANDPMDDTLPAPKKGDVMKVDNSTKIVFPDNQTKVVLSN